MSGAAIRDEVTAALAEASAEVGDGPLVMTLERETNGDGPTDPWGNGNGNGPDYTPLNAVQASLSVAHVDGTLIQAQDRRFLVQAEVDIKPSHRLHIQGKVYQIVRAEPTAPGGLALMWDVIVRGPVEDSSL